MFEDKGIVDEPVIFRGDEDKKVKQGSMLGAGNLPQEKAVYWILVEIIFPACSSSALLVFLDASSFSAFFGAENLAYLRNLPKGLDQSHLTTLCKRNYFGADFEYLDFPTVYILSVLAASQGLAGGPGCVIMNPN